MSTLDRDNHGPPEFRAWFYRCEECRYDSPEGEREIDQLPFRCESCQSDLIQPYSDWVQCL